MCLSIPICPTDCFQKNLPKTLIFFFFFSCKILQVPPPFTYFLSLVLGAQTDWCSTLRPDRLTVFRSPHSAKSSYSLSGTLVLGFLPLCFCGTKGSSLVLQWNACQVFVSCLKAGDTLSSSSSPTQHLALRRHAVNGC